MQTEMEKQERRLKWQKGNTAERDFDILAFGDGVEV
jgi:hypothetical protein